MSRMTDRDREIMQHIDKFRFITLKQTVELFMSPTSSNAHLIADKRLTVIQESNHLFGTKGVKLRKGKHPYTKETIYYYGNMPSYHDLQVLNVYARLSFIGLEIDFFTTQKTWCHGKYRSDAFFSYTIGEDKRVAFLEVCHTSNDTHIKGYEEIYTSGELQEKLVGSFPGIVLVGHKGPLPDTLLKVRKVKENLSDIYNVFI